MSFKPMNEVTMPAAGEALAVTWETKMTFGQHKGETPEQVSGDDPMHAYGYFKKLEDVGKIKMDRECRNLLEEAFDSAKQDSDEYMDEFDGLAGDGY